jgi:hypothetical protein
MQYTSTNGKMESALSDLPAWGVLHPPEARQIKTKSLVDFFH